MQYLSPLSFLPPGISGLTAKELKLAKNKLMAEFELTSSSTITLAGKEVSRNDVLKLFDQLEQAGDLEYHALVASSPVLLHFMEHHEILPEQKFDLPEEKITPEFIDWISPSFSFAFRKATTRMFREVEPKELETLIVNPILMNDRDTWEAWSGVENFLQLTLEDFSKINNAKYHSAAQVKKYAGYDFVWLMCNIPEDRFAPEINSYAFELMQMAIKQFNSKHRDSAFEIMGYARSLRVSEQMMSSLIEKEREMTSIIKEKRGPESQTWLYIRIGAAVIYFLFRIATCNS